MQWQRSRFSSFISLEMWSRSTVLPPLMCPWKALIGGPEHVDTTLKGSLCAAVSLASTIRRRSDWDEEVLWP